MQEDVDSGNEKPLLVTTEENSTIMLVVGLGKLMC